MVEVNTDLDRLARAYPEATITLKELADGWSDVQVTLCLHVTCTERGEADRPYESNGDPGEQGWCPEFDYEVTDLMIEGEHVSVSGIKWDTLVCDLGLDDQAHSIATNREIHLEDRFDG
jgi:hypothetical protein|tara:strand:- start:8492 stop:8848 length:357 start_codon:yes stop_codon:yes gene_type:complete